MAKGVIIGFGDKGFEKAVDIFEKEMERDVIRIVAETVEIAVSNMKALAPVGGVDGGNLKRSIDAVYKNKGMTAVITVGAEYGIKRMSSLLVTAG